MKLSSNLKDYDYLKLRSSEIRLQNVCKLS